ncbi:MAG: DUF2852 domain-containing protein [Rhodopseudomonas sp.]|nr:DUF2852 domain-containing protein [Rhodopseudomonas sp.]
MPITARLDEFGKPAWIALTVLGFMAWWPVGLAVLAFTIGSGRMGCGYRGGSDRWQHKMDRLQAKMDWMRSKMSGGQPGGSPWRGSPWSGAPSSGNRAFDDYRAETLKRLEDEQRQFKDFLERLRFAKDKTEFDAFMAERRNRPAQDSQPHDPNAAPGQATGHDQPYQSPPSQN